MFMKNFLRQREICILTAVVLGSVVWMWSGIRTQASGETVVTHVHTGSSTAGGGCYTRRNAHVHTGDSETGGGCYTVPVYHSHAGNPETGGGCYTVALPHVHTGNAETGGGCYTAPVYHSHTGSSESGGGCYTVPVYHSHSGCEAAYANGCYTKKEERRIAVPCGIFVDDGDGYWHCNHCGVRTPDSNVPVDRSHSPYTSRTVYTLGCGKSETVAERYLAGCGKDETTLEGYETACGMSESTVVSYRAACGKNQGTIESYALQCDRTADGYAPGCGRTEQTVERYETGCGAPVTYSVGCGHSQGEVLGSLRMTESGGCLYVEADGIAVEGYRWSDGSRERTLSETRPGTVYTCTVSYLDGTARHSVELTAKTEEERAQEEEPASEEGTTGEQFSDSEAGPARILRKSLYQREAGGASDTAPDMRKDAWLDREEVSGFRKGMEEIDEAWEDIWEEMEVPLAKIPDAEAAAGEKEDEYGEGAFTTGELIGPSAVLYGSRFSQRALVAVCAVSAPAAAAVLFLLWSRCAVLYCYDDRERYRMLGILRAGREKDGYRVRIAGRKLDRGATRRYRIAVNRWLRGKREGSRFVVETDRQKLNLVLEEYVDFAL